jgi:hypothetical protein
LTHLEITVTQNTKLVDGVTTRVVEERESEDNQLVEVSRNYFAVCTQTNSVFYFGEQTDLYENGQITGHEGSWESGVNGAKFGLVMPGIVLIGARYAQEIAPGVAMDQAEVTSTDETVQTPLKTFQHAIQTAETSPLEKKSLEYKWYAAGTGLIQDDFVKLVSSAVLP